ncbi:E3 ubiquitin-protein ligase TRIP12-like isoform X2 [Clytia hemisphaerica]|uniref:E3 ubiquitin-protein ligase n=1 Tax=Clytia hemisphaerica TaxID=252671 RepID=A0A7M5WJK5_9CNID
MADDVRDDQARSISSSSDLKKKTKLTRQNSNSRKGKQKKAKEGQGNSSAKSKILDNCPKPTKRGNTKKIKSAENISTTKTSASSSVNTTKTKDSVPKSSKRKTSDSSLTQDQPGPSGVNKQRKKSTTSVEKELKREPAKKRKGKNKSANSTRRTRSASESNLPENTPTAKEPLKKTKSDSAVEPPRKGKKRKSKALPAFSPKKLRSSSSLTATGSSTKTTAATSKETKRKKSSVKTGARSSRGSNPPEVDEPAGDSSSADKLGSCASRRRNRRSRLQRGEAPEGMENGGNSNADNQETENASNDDQSSEAPLAGAVAALSTSENASSSTDNDLASNLEESDMSRLQALLEARGLPAHLFGSLGPRMHLLLHKTFNSGAGAKAQQLLTSMQSEDEGTQLQGVMEMCQMLVMGNEETLGGFPVKQSVPVLVTLLQMEHNFDIMNHACRALTYLMEGLPRSSVVVIEAVPTLLEKLQTIQCMDVAEQSLTALEMLSKRHGKNILQAGGLGSSLLYLDFFSIVAQRSALAITANCCHSVTVDDFQYVKDSIQVLSNRLTQQDKKSLESVCLAFARLVDNVQNEKALIEELCEHNLLANLKQLLIISPPLISSNTFVTVIRMLATMCSCSSAIAVKLLKLNITETLRYILIGNNDAPTDEIVDLVPRSPQELYELVCLISELLPELPTDGVFSIDAQLRKGTLQNSQLGLWQWKDDKSNWHSYTWVDNRIIEAAYQGGEDEISLSTLGRNYIIDFSNMQQINEDTGTIRSIQRKMGSNAAASSSSSQRDCVIKETDERSCVFEEDNKVGKGVVQSLIAIVFDVYYSSVGPAVKHKCLTCLLKMIYHSPPDLLKAVLGKIPISSYIAGMLSSSDLRTVCSALQKADILMSKLTETFHVYFRREGVMHRIKTLTESDEKDGSRPSSKASSPEDSKHGQAVGGSGKKVSSNDSIEVSASSSSSTSKLASLRNRKKNAKKLKGKSSKSSLNDDSPPSLRSKRSNDGMRPKSATFSSSAHSTNTGSNVASKASFFASFTPRWGRSQSFQNTSSSSNEKSLKENLGKEIEENREKIRSWIRTTAQELYEKYFTDESGISHPALDILLKLTSAAKGLTLKGDDDLEALEKIREVLTQDFQEGASAFEMVHSGMVTQLLKYLTENGTKDGSSRASRIKKFLKVFLGLANTDGQSHSFKVNASTKPVLVSLVQKLNLCINQIEQFPVKCQDIPGSGVGGGSRGSSALRFFNTHQIKCNLQRHPDCSNVKQWCGGAVKIDPLALVQAIERYLVVRGYGRVREDIDSELSDDDERSDDEIEEGWASQLQVSNNPKHILEFTLNGHVLPYSMTVYQAVRQYAKTSVDSENEMDDESGPFGRASIWSGTHTIYFRPVTQPTESGPSTSTSTASSSLLTSSSKRSKTAIDTTSTATSSSSSSAIKPSIATPKDSTDAQSKDAYLTSTLPGDLNLNDPSVDVICLMRVLYYLNCNWRKFFDLHSSQPVISFNEFVNSKLTAKATRQLQDPLVIMTGNLPTWLIELAKVCPFLFPFECRQLLFYSTTFDRDRAIMKLQETVPDLASTDSNDRVAPRLDKKKRTVNRTDLFKQAENILNEFTGTRALLEIQYDGEVGTGLGPTLEFYSLVSKEFQRSDLEIWRNDSVTKADIGGSDSKKKSSYAFSKDGLFPAAIPKNTKSSHVTKIKSKFRYLGKFMAKACMDSRMVDINLSEAFYKWIVTQDYTSDICDLRHVDQTLYASLSQLYNVALAKRRLENDESRTQESIDSALSILTLDGVPIEDLGLDFVLPGTNYELKKNGRNTPVTIENLDEYLQLVVEYTLVDGVSVQLQAFKEGFEQFFKLSNLQMFYPHEIDLLLCGSKSEKWDSKELMECCRADHGYNIDSRAVKFLFEILSKYEADEQRLFLQFITGSPKLPVGGFKSLNPPLTIVRKTVDQSANPDNYLPSVMTCVNYLKLPDYSNVEIMSTKLRTAYSEGKNAFHLS